MLLLYICIQQKIFPCLLSPKFNKLGFSKNISSKRDFLKESVEL